MDEIKYLKRSPQIMAQVQSYFFRAKSNDQLAATLSSEVTLIKPIVLSQIVPVMV